MQQTFPFYASQASHDFLQYENSPSLSGTCVLLQTNRRHSESFAMCLSCGKDYGRKQDWRRHLDQCVMRIPGPPSGNQGLAGLPPREEGYALFEDAICCWVRPTIRGDGERSVVYFSYEYQRRLLIQWMDAATADTYMWRRFLKRQERFSRAGRPRPTNSSQPGTTPQSNFANADASQDSQPCTNPQFNFADADATAGRDLTSYNNSPTTVIIEERNTIQYAGNAYGESAVPTNLLRSIAVSSRVFVVSSSIYAVSSSMSTYLQWKEYSFECLPEREVSQDGSQTTEPKQDSERIVLPEKYASARHQIKQRMQRVSWVAEVNMHSVHANGAGTLPFTPEASSALLNHGSLLLAGKKWRATNQVTKLLWFMALTAGGSLSMMW